MANRKTSPTTRGYHVINRVNRPILDIVNYINGLVIVLKQLIALLGLQTHKFT
jgi:hypothetical protein